MGKIDQAGGAGKSGAGRHVLRQIIRDEAAPLQNLDATRTWELAFSNRHKVSDENFVIS
jgi:hypothetical protein